MASGLPRSTYYFEINKPDIDELKNAQLIADITFIFNKHGSKYGVRRVYKELKKKQNVNHKKVQRIMNKLGLKGKKPKEKYHSYKGEVGVVADNLINRNFKATKPNEKWSTDVSQFNFNWGKCYLSPILDMFNDEIVSYNLSLHPNFEQVTDMLDKAFKKNNNLKGLIFHSDQGWQYQNRRYISLLKDKGIKQSMSRKGNCYDNCIIESFFGTIKREIYYGQESTYGSFEDFSKAVDKYIEYFNNERIQAKTKWMSPIEYRMTSISV